MANELELDIKPSKKSEQNFDKFVDKVESNPIEPDISFKEAEKEANSFVDNLKKNLGGISTEGFLSGLAGGGAFAVAQQGLDIIAGSISDIYNNANEFNSALNDIQAKTGATADEMKRLETASKEAFLGGVGESLADATRVIGEAQTLLGDTFSGEELGDFTAKAQALGNLFDKDVTEVIGKATPFIKQFGLSSEEAFNLLAKGLREGKTPSDDLLDTFAEYSQLVSKAGFSAAQFTEILTSGAEEGLFNLDKIADSIKEAEIRIKAGDVGDALSKIGGADEFQNSLIKSVEAVAKAGQSGELTIQETLQKSTKLIDDAFKDGKISESLASQLQVAIAGTPAEDIGTELFGKIFSAELDEATINASAQKIGAEVSNAVGQYTSFDAFKRQTELLLTDSLKTAIVIIDDIVKFLADNFDKIAISVGVTAVAIAGYTLVMNAGAIATGIATGAMTAFNAVMALNPAVAIALAIGGLTLGVLALSDALNVTTEEQIELNQEQINQIEQQKELNRSQRRLQDGNLDLIKSYKELGSNSDRTAEQQKEYEQVQLKLAETYPGVISGTADFSTNLSALEKEASKVGKTIDDLDKQYNKLNESQKKLAKEQINLKIALAEENAFEEFENFLGLGGTDIKKIFNESKNKILKEWDSSGLQEIGLQLQIDAFDQLNKLGAETSEIEAYQKGIKEILDLQQQRIIANGGVIETTKELQDLEKKPPPPPAKVDLTLEEIIKKLVELQIAGKGTTKEFNNLFASAKKLVAKEKSLADATKDVKLQLGLLNAEADKFLEFVRKQNEETINIDFKIQQDEAIRSIAKVGASIEKELNIDGALKFDEAVKSIENFYENQLKDREKFKNETINLIEFQSKLELDKIQKAENDKLKAIEKTFEEQAKLYENDKNRLAEIEVIKEEAILNNQKEFNNERANLEADNQGKITEITQKTTDEIVQLEKDKQDRIKQLSEEYQSQTLDSINAIGGEYADLFAGISEGIFKIDELVKLGKGTWQDYGAVISSVLGEITKKLEEGSVAQKALGITQAIINTAIGVTKAYGLPFPLNFIQSALIGTLGAVQIAKIAGAESGVIGIGKGYNGKVGATDTIPLMVAPGESIINAESSSRNRGWLEFANNGGDISREIVEPLLANNKVLVNEIKSLKGILSRSTMVNQKVNLVVENRNNSSVKLGAVRV